MAVWDNLLHSNVTGMCAAHVYVFVYGYGRKLLPFAMTE